MLENLYPKLPSAPSMSQESFNIEMVRKYYQDIANLKERYTEKQWKYKIWFLTHGLLCLLIDSIVTFANRRPWVYL